MKILRRALPVLFIAGAAACGSDSAPSTPAEPTPTTPTPTTPTPGNPAATLSAIQNAVFDPSCVDCHGPDHSHAGLDLSAGRAHENLVSAPSIQVALNLVTPGDAENSYLIHKLEGRAGIVGDRMPPAGPFVTGDDLDAIRQWIDDGAAND